MELEGTVNREGWTDQQATDAAVKVMIDYAKKDVGGVTPLVRSFTDDLHDNKSKMLAIRNWVLQNLKYVKDEVEAKRLYGVEHPEGVELVKSPLAVLESGIYDCDCGATLIASMLLAIDINARFIVIGFYDEQFAGSGAFEHVLAQGLLDSGEWFTIDPVSYPDERRMLEDTRQYKVYEIS